PGLGPARIPRRAREPAGDRPRQMEDRNPDDGHRVPPGGPGGAPERAGAAHRRNRALARRRAHARHGLGLSAPWPRFHARQARRQGGGMKIFGLAGWSGAGKTSLMVRLLPELVARGITVSTMKHAHHAFDVDQPGKDSYEHRRAGATEVLVTSEKRWALMHELRGAPEAEMEALVARMTPVDLLLIEGFKHHAHDKLEVFRRAVGKPLLCVSDPRVVAV